MNGKGLRGIGPLAAAYEVDQELLDHSRAARVGHRIIQLAVLVRTIEPALALIAAVLLAIMTLAHPALAQVQGGNIFGQNDQAVGSGLRELIRYGRNALFLLGIGGIGWGAFNYMTEKSWGRQMLGGGISMGIGGILSLIYSFSQGNAVNLDTDLGQ
jgi:hypothetical protein